MAEGINFPHPWCSSSSDGGSESTLIFLRQFKSLASYHKEYFSFSEEYNHEVLRMRNSFGVANKLLRGGLLVFVLNDGGGRDGLRQTELCERQRL
ncbi:hypothetical protein CDAR_593171 [Caerostris darwini]|uniref:Uncharacterized protein n=1 Tax=Caerostris darwini TaxID=1538125 RepID=A0AAV4TY77_9ARAC|nr:hypothetical protein CDAR_593171 [Caerostris darwini]